MRILKVLASNIYLLDLRVDILIKFKKTCALYLTYLPSFECTYMVLMNNSFSWSLIVLAPFLSTFV